MACQMHIYTYLKAHSVLCIKPSWWKVAVRGKPQPISHQFISVSFATFFICGPFLPSLLPCWKSKIKLPPLITINSRAFKKLWNTFSKKNIIMFMAVSLFSFWKTSPRDCFSSLPPDALFSCFFDFSSAHNTRSYTDQKWMSVWAFWPCWEAWEGREQLHLPQLT